MKYISVFIVSAIAAVALTVAVSYGGGSSATPTHVASVYVDGINHGDFRQACSVIQPNVLKYLWKSWTGCADYFAHTFGSPFTGSLGGYKLVAHSYDEWLEGKAIVARVRMTSPTGTLLKIRLVKTKNFGWRLQSVGE